jgi:hypothetical protein
MITKFRCSNIKLPIETGRWSNTPREERICHLCNVGVGTEFHFLFECTSADVQRLRCKFTPIYCTRYAKIYKMKGLLSLCNVKVLKKMSLFFLCFVIISCSCIILSSLYSHYVKYFVYYSSCYTEYVSERIKT